MFCCIQKQKSRATLSFFSASYTTILREMNYYTAKFHLIEVRHDFRTLGKVGGRSEVFSIAVHFKINCQMLGFIFKTQFREIHIDKERKRESYSVKKNTNC